VNRSVTWANWDDELLAQELRDIEESGLDIALTGFDSKEIDDLLASLEEEEPSDKVPLPPAVPASRTGDLFFVDHTASYAETLRKRPTWRAYWTIASHSSW